MLLTETELKQTIRRILLENQQDYEKLAIMIFSAEIPNINQALDLAETLDYITDLKYREFESYIGGETIYEWTFVISSDDFMNELREQYPDRYIRHFHLYSPDGKNVEIQVKLKNNLVYSPKHNF